MPRLPALSAFAFALLLPALALADVPPADAGAIDFDCTVAVKSTDGHSCATCQITSSDTSCEIELGTNYHFVCQHDPKVQVWCDGPGSSPSGSCALAAPPGSATLAGGGALAALIGLLARARRRRLRARG